MKISNRVVISASLDRDILAKMDEEAKRLNLTRSNYIEFLFQNLVSSK